MLGMERKALSWLSRASRVMVSRAGNWDSGIGIRGGAAIPGSRFPNPRRSNLAPCGLRGRADRPPQPGEGAVPGGALHQRPERGDARLDAFAVRPVPPVEPVEVGAIDPDRSEEHTSELQ